MKVDISSIKEIRGGSIVFQGNQEIETGGLNLELELEGPVAVKGSVTNTGEGFLVQGEVSFKYHTNCSRCLEPVSGLRRVEITEQFASYTPSETDDQSQYYYQGDLIDLSDCIRDQVFLAIPMKYVCKNDCRGLCPHCGQNLNLKSCDCHTEDYNPQFLKLKSLLNQEGGGSDGKPEK